MDLMRRRQPKVGCRKTYPFFMWWLWENDMKLATTTALLLG